MTVAYKKAEADAKEALAMAQTIASKPNAKDRVNEIRALLASVFSSAHLYVRRGFPIQIYCEIFISSETNTIIRAEVTRTDVWAHFPDGPDPGHIDAVKFLNDKIFLPAHALLAKFNIPYDGEWIHGKAPK